MSVIVPTATSFIFTRKHLLLKVTLTPRLPLPYLQPLVVQRLVPIHSCRFTSLFNLINTSLHTSSSPTSPSSSHTSLELVMSGSIDRRPSFLSLVPTYQRIYVEVEEEPNQLTRRYSIASSVLSFASSISFTNDYGENGFLVLTSALNDELVIQEDG